MVDPKHPGDETAPQPPSGSTDVNKAAPEKAEGGDEQVEGIKFTAIALEEIDIQQLWKNGAYFEVVDNLCERKQIDDLRKFALDRHDASRVVLYLMSVSKLSAEQGEQKALLNLSFDMSVTHGDLITAFIAALQLKDDQMVYELFDICRDVENKPGESRMLPVVSSEAWPESVRLEYSPAPDRKDEEKKTRELMMLQLAHFAAQHKLGWDKARIIAGGDMVEEAELEESPLIAILRREYLPDLYSYMAAELEVEEDRAPKDVFKNDSSESSTRRMRASANVLDAQSTCTTETYATSFVNAGFCHDLLVTPAESQHISKSQQDARTAAIAGIGLTCQWNVADGLDKIDKFQYASDPYTRAGALLAFGINSAGIQNPCDPVMTLVSDSMSSANATEKLAGIAALAYAYSGSAREDIAELLIPVVVNGESATEISALAALALGMVFVGTANESACEAILQVLLERQDNLDSIHSFNYAAGLALLFVQRQEEREGVLEGLAAVNHPIGELASILIEGAAFVGTGNVLKVQELIRRCIKVTDQATADENNKEDEDGYDSEGNEKGKPKEGTAATARPEDDANRPGAVGTPTAPGERPDASGDQRPSAGDAAPGPQTTSAEGPSENPEAGESRSGVAAEGEKMTDNAVVKLVKDSILSSLPGATVVALGMITMGSEIDMEMFFRLCNHLLQFDGLFVRRGIPCALALQSASNPRPVVVDFLSKLSHDVDADTALHAIVALGIIAAGTNNSRVAQVLRQLASFYGGDAHALFLVRLMQGVLYAGKGLLSLSAVHCHRQLVNQPGLAGLFAFCVQALYTEETLCTGRSHLNLYHLVPALHSRWLITLDGETMQPVAVTVRVGQAIDTAGSAGDPKKITGFRTHNTPVLLSFDEKVQMGTEEWQPMSPVLEGIVIVRKLAGRQRARAAKALD